MPQCHDVRLVLTKFEWLRIHLMISYDFSGISHLSMPTHMASGGVSFT